MRSSRSWLGLVFSLAIAAPALADSEAAGPFSGAQIAFPFGLQCSAVLIDATNDVAQPVGVMIKDRDGDVVSQFPTALVQPGETATASLGGPIQGSDTAFSCHATSPGDINTVFSIIGNNEDAMIAGVGQDVPDGNWAAEVAAFNPCVNPCVPPPPRRCGLLGIEALLPLLLVRRWRRRQSA